LNKVVLWIVVLGGVVVPIATMLGLLLTL